MWAFDHRREPLTLKEVGSEMGVTKERIRQLEVKALSRLETLADMNELREDRQERREDQQERREERRDGDHDRGW